jgi:hypothetical protein
MNALGWSRFNLIHSLAGHEPASAKVATEFAAANGMEIVNHSDKRLIPNYIDPDTIKEDVTAAAEGIIESTVRPVLIIGEAYPFKHLIYLLHERGVLPDDYIFVS